MKSAVCACVRACMHACMRAVHACMHACMRACVRACVTNSRAIFGRLRHQAICSLHECDKVGLKIMFVVPMHRPCVPKIALAESDLCVCVCVCHELTCYLWLSVCVCARACHIYVLSLCVLLFLGGY